MNILVDGLEPGKETNENNTFNVYGVYTCNPRDQKALTAYSTNLQDDSIAVPVARKDHVFVIMSKGLVSCRFQNEAIQDTCWSFIAIDEARQAKKYDTALYLFLSKQPTYTFILFLSATSCDKSPKDIQPPIQVIQRKFHHYRRATNKIKAKLINLIKSIRATTV